MQCESSRCHALSGIFNMSCLICCVRLVKSARPSRKQQEIMLVSIARFKNGNEVILSKLEKWNSRSSLRWDNAIDLLRKAQERWAG